jgi:hypothetical protein
MTTKVVIGVSEPGRNPVRVFKESYSRGRDEWERLRQESQVAEVGKSTEMTICAGGLVDGKPTQGERVVIEEVDD